MNEGIGTVSKPSDSLAILGAEQSGDESSGFHVRC